MGYEGHNVTVASGTSAGFTVATSTPPPPLPSLLQFQVVFYDNI